MRLPGTGQVGIDRFTGHYGGYSGYYAAKKAHERAAQAGPIPVAPPARWAVHEFVAPLVDWGSDRTG